VTQMKPQWVVIDTETTGLSSEDRIIEIAALAVDAESMVVIDRFTCLVNPGRDTGAEQVHGISEAMVRFAPPFGEIASEFARFLHGRVLVAHNLSFDRRFLVQEFNNAELAIDLGQGFCTWRQGTMRTLAASCEMYGITLDGAHRAEADARATAELLGQLDARHNTPVSPVIASSVAQLN